ncbi:hypothetical protein HZS_2463 [Henneguya salminicola]|nr:hypothetical protein HZS_2463 [Henneguya salminicola]
MSQTDQIVEDMQQNCNPQLSEIDVKNIKLYKRRYLVLLVIFLALFSNGEVWMTHVSVSNESASYYKTTPEVVNWFGTILLLVYAVVAIPFTILSKKIGLKSTIVFGCAANFSGSVLRLISLIIPDDNRTVNLAISLLGNAVFGVAMGILYGLPVMVSSVWLGDKERSIGVSGTYMANAVGVGVGFLDIYLAIGTSSDDVHIKNSFLYITIGETILNTLVLVLSILFVTETPPTPPSHSEAMKSRKLENISFWDATIKLLKEMYKVLMFENSIVAFFIFIASYGSYVTLFMLLSQFIPKFVEKPIHLTGYIGAIGVILGGFNTVIFGYIKGFFKNKRNRLIGITINVFCALPLMAIFLLIIVKKFDNTNSMVLFIFYLTFAPVYIGIGCEILGEITFPIDENVSSTMALILANIFGASLTYILGLLKENQYQACLGICISLYIINCLLFMIKFGRNRPEVNDELKSKES